MITEIESIILKRTKMKTDIIKMKIDNSWHAKHRHWNTTNQNWNIKHKNWNRTNEVLNIKHEKWNHKDEYPNAKHKNWHHKNRKAIGIYQNFTNGTP